MDHLKEERVARHSGEIEALEGCQVCRQFVVFLSGSFLGALLTAACFFFVVVVFFMFFLFFCFCFFCPRQGSCVCDHALKMNASFPPLPRFCSFQIRTLRTWECLHLCPVGTLLPPSADDSPMLVCVFCLIGEGGEGGSPVLTVSASQCGCATL